MIPAMIIYYFANGSTIYIKSFCQIFYVMSFVFIQSSYIFNLKGRKLCVPRCSSFFNFISDIVRMGSQKKMIRPYAFRVVAFMANNLPPWIFFVVHKIRESMRGNNFTFPKSSTNNSIASALSCAGPVPTFLSFNNFRPKSFFNSGADPHNMKILSGTGGVKFL